MKTKKILFPILSVLLAAATVADLVGLSNALYGCDSILILLFIIGGLIAPTGYFLTVFVGLSGWKKKNYIPAAVVFSVSFAAVWIFLFGFHADTIGIVLSCFLLILAPLCILKKRGVLTAVAVLLIAVCLSVPLYFVGKIEIREREKTVDLVAYDDPTLLPHAQKAEIVYHLHVPYGSTTADYVFLKSLQGYLSLTSGTQVFYTFAEEYEYSESIYDMHEEQTETARRYFDVPIIDLYSEDELLARVGYSIGRYIVCDPQDMTALSVAISLCNQMDAILVPSAKHEFIAEKYGWEKVFDANGKDQRWLMASPYFDNISKSVIIVATEFYYWGSLLDYAIVANAWLVPQFRSQKELETYLPYMKRDFILYGIRGDDYAYENELVWTVAKYGGTYCYSSGMDNVSVLSSFRLENVKQGVSLPKNKTTVTDYSKNGISNRHTVCMMLSDGDNMQYTGENNVRNPKFFGSELRSEDFDVSYGMSGIVVKMMPLMLLSYFDKMYPNESLVMQLSSIAYTYPSKWTDEEAYEEVLKNLVSSMQISDIHVVELMDDTSFMNAFEIPAFFGGMQRHFDRFTESDQISGLLFISYQQRYNGFKGAVCWSNDKPVVSAKYSLWSAEKGGTEENGIDYIARSINASSRDVTSEDAYSFIIVHAWSGLDENGNLGSGDTMAAMQKLASLFDDDVDLVSADEFINRMSYYVKR